MLNDKISSRNNEKAEKFVKEDLLEVRKISEFLQALSANFTLLCE